MRATALLLALAACGTPAPDEPGSATEEGAAAACETYVAARAVHLEHLRECGANEQRLAEEAYPAEQCGLDEDGCSADDIALVATMAACLEASSVCGDIGALLCECTTPCGGPRLSESCQLRPKVRYCLPGPC